MMEAVAAICYLMGGSDVVILRHPESVRLTRAFVDLMLNGGTAGDVREVSKKLKLQEPDLVAISPKPDLDFGAEEVAPKAKAAKPKEKPKAEPKPEKKVAKPKKKEEKPAAPKAEKKVVEMKPKEKPAAEKAEKEKPKAEAAAEAKAKAEADAKAKAEADAKAKAEAEARAKAEEESKARAKAEEGAKARAEAKAKESEDLQALRHKRAQEREKHLAKVKETVGKEVPKTPAREQLDMVERLTLNIDRIHRRVQ